MDKRDDFPGNYDERPSLDRSREDDRIAHRLAGLLLWYAGLVVGAVIALFIWLLW